MINIKKSFLNYITMVLVLNNPQKVYMLLNKESKPIKK